MKTLIFLLVMGCIFSVGAYTPLNSWDSYRYGAYQYDRYSQFPSFWERPERFFPQGFQRFQRFHYAPQSYSDHSRSSYFNYPQSDYSDYSDSSYYNSPPSYSRPFPILATGRIIQPDPGDQFPWQYYPDSYAQQYYDLDKGEVLIKGNTFLPSTTRVQVGNTVTWKSKEGYPHVVKSAWEAADSFDSKSLIFGESFSKKFDQEGTYDYYDPLYPWMRGRVVASAG